MACFHPLPAWRSHAGAVRLGAPGPLSRCVEYLCLPCGSCHGCRARRARDWAIRCQLESAEHVDQCWCTLTYDDVHLPPTLQKDHLSGWLKRLRARVHPRSVRFFACGEYGERTNRPHYHSILFGLRESAARVIQDTWPHGFARTDRLTPAAIAYVAGYSSKKLGWSSNLRGEQVDPATGEAYEYQPPFVQMSRRPGIGGAARRFVSSWRKHAILDGRAVGVPRYLHEAWVKQATDAELDSLRSEFRALFRRERTKAELHAAELHSVSRQLISSSARTL